MTEDTIHVAVISVGSNIDPEHNVAKARELLAAETGLRDETKLQWTAPVGFLDQPDFLNGAFLVETTLDYPAFKDYLRSVEDRLGRVRGGVRDGPRTIDLDIIIWDGRVFHEDYPAREYVSVPVDDLVTAHRITVLR